MRGLSAVQVGAFTSSGTPAAPTGASGHVDRCGARLRGGAAPRPWEVRDPHQGGQIQQILPFRSTGASVLHRDCRQVFFTDIVRLHGVPQSMVSDQDPVFMSNFWHELMRLLGTKLHMTTTFHPQSDGQFEAANRVIIMYLWCLTGDKLR